MPLEENTNSPSCPSSAEKGKTKQEKPGKNDGIVYDKIEDSPAHSDKMDSGILKKDKEKSHSTTTKDSGLKSGDKKKPTI